MKQIIQFLCLFALFFCISYLLGAFIETSFDISKWKFESRQAVSILGGCMSFICSIVVVGILNENI